MADSKQGDVIKLMQNTIEIKSIDELLEIQNLEVPSYQRPYKWSKKNIALLLQDIEDAIVQKKKKCK